MFKIKQIEQMLRKYSIKFETYTIEKKKKTEKRIEIYICRVGDNFYDYGEHAPKKLNFFPRIDDTLKEVLLTDPRIHFIYCEDCCGCAGW